ncbi:hypothetical protein [Streptomyces sp. NPDC051310]|uniref:hypothetical protein n=1 Tax=Streptomyces sp. NPDC051310 TaxID=3365649 RepID=UPI0037BD21D6
MRVGDELRFRGPAGAPFVVTVGPAFDEKTIRARIASGEWTPLDESAPADDTDEQTVKRPAVNATKSDWVTYAVTHLGMDRDQAEDLTKQQLIDNATQAPAPSSEEKHDGQ